VLHLNIIKFCLFVALRSSSKNNTHFVTNYIRGLAIALVVFSHFFISYNSDFYQEWLNNYANAFISVFFIVAGYGAYYSLIKRFGEGRATYSVLIRYYWDRATRIYPLYWLALILIEFFDNEYFKFQELGLAKSLSIFLAIPTVISPLWFVPAIIQCYLFSPLFLRLIKRLSSRRCIGIAAVMMGVIWMASHEFHHIFPHFEALVPDGMVNEYMLLYRDVFLGNVFLFGLGMLLPKIIHDYGDILNKRWLLYLTELTAVASLVLLRYNRTTIHDDVILAELLFYICMFFFCLVIIAQQPRLPLQKYVSTMGKYSYSIYVFHGSFIMIMVSLGLLSPGKPLDTMFSIAMIVLMIYAAALLEKKYSRIRPIVSNNVAEKGRRLLLKKRLFQVKDRVEP
jgi:peptidoglycan/LPS O-acetylase OafA/YrhL